MKQKLNSIPLWTRIKLPAKILAALAFAGLVGSAQAQVTYTPFLTNVWVVPAGTYSGMPANGNNNCRGIAINPVTTNVLYFSSTGGTNNGVNHVGTVAFASGSNFIAGLNGTGISGGTVGTEGVRVADDGTVYAINLSGSPASSFKIYKWPSDTDIVTAPTIVANTAGASFQWRAGDYSDLRGSGINTELVVVGNGSGVNLTTNFIIYRPTDASCTTFTNFTITIPGSVTINLCGAGVAFEGTNNAIWIRRAGSAETRRIAYNPTTLTATCDRTNNVDQTVCQGLKYWKSTNGVELLATVQPATGNGANQIARVFQIPVSPTAALVSVLSSNIPAVTGSVNGNALGNVDAKNGYFVFGAPGHGLSLFKVEFITTAPPGSVTMAASASTFVSGYNQNVTFTTTATGSAPLSNQWFYVTATATNLIPGVSLGTYTINNVQTTNAGGYFVIVTNLYGRATSAVANITVFPNGTSPLMTNLWTLAPGSRPYITGAGTDTQRGMAYDANSNRVVLVSRVSHTNLNDLTTVQPYGVILLDGNTGAEAGELDVSALLAITPPGTFPINMCGVGDDGIVYVGNLITSGNSDSYAIYSWTSADPSATIGQAYAGNPLAGAGSLGRIGDTMAVRGAGTNTQIVCGFRTGTNACIFTTTDGVNFNPTIIAIGNIPDGADGLSVYWGPDNTFWTKSDFNLRQVSFDLNTGTGTVLASYPVPTQETIVGVDNANGYAATIGTRETPQNLAIYDITTPGGPSINTLVDRELFGANNPPGNATGSVAMDSKGGRIFALDSNSGILAVSYAGRLSIAKDSAGQVITWPTASSVLQSSANVLGPYADIMGATSPYTNSVGGIQFFRLKH